MEEKSFLNQKNVLNKYKLFIESQLLHSDPFLYTLAKVGPKIIKS